MAEGTPMMQQYHRIKDELPDCILFFRLGDFYEMFNEDARTAARELDLALTTLRESRYCLIISSEAPMAPAEATAWAVMSSRVREPRAMSAMEASSSSVGVEAMAA